MKMTTQEIPLVMAEYVDSQVAPKANGMQKFGTYAMLYVVNNKLPEIVTRYTPIMRMTGIMDDAGAIDLDYVHSMAADAMSHAGSVNVLGFNMDGTDVESLYAIAQRHGR